MTQNILLQNWILKYTLSGAIAAVPETQSKGLKLIFDQALVFYFSLEEFIASTQQAEFRQDDGWKPVNEQQVYSQEELRQFEMQQHHINQLIAEGKVSMMFDFFF